MFWAGFATGVGVMTVISMMAAYFAGRRMRRIIKVLMQNRLRKLDK